MNLLDKVFKDKTKTKKAIYTVVGHPSVQEMYQVFDSLMAKEIDIIELGMPFSDPVADGPVIQKIHEKTLKQNITFEHFFAAAKYIRSKSDIPLVGMGYINPILAYGIENFLDKSKKTGINALIIPDMPPEEFERNFKKYFKQIGIYPIFLVSPNTPDDRVRYIDSLSKGFLYAVSGLSVTGTLHRDNDHNTARDLYLSRLKKLTLQNPLMVGFGISSAADLHQVGKHADGAIIGTAFLNALNKEKSISENIENFFKDLQ